MKRYLDELFANYSKISHNTDEKINQYKQKIKDFILWDKPDFVALIGPESTEIFPYQQNIRINFYDHEECVIEAAKFILPEQKELIAKIDIRTMEYLFEVESKPMDILFKLRFNIEFEKGDVRTMVRKIHLIEVNKYGKPKIGLLGITDMTNVIKGERIVFEAKTENPQILFSKEYKRYIKDVNDILNCSNCLTSRENEILQLIFEGKSSQDIALILNIAKTTVDKHRQNMMKKHKVSNVTSLFKLLN